MSGAGKLFLGIILAIVFFLTLTVESVPIIWTGAGVVGAIFIYQGLREMVKGKQYKCKTCGFKGSQRVVLEHALNAHPEQFTEEEKDKLSIALGLKAPPETLISSSEQTNAESDEEFASVTE